MKELLIHVTLIITLLSAANINGNAQSNHDSLSQRLNLRTPVSTQNLKKSHDQKVAGIVLLTGGSIMALTGLALTVASLNGLFDPDVPHKDYGSAPDILGIGGAVLMVGSVPFLIASHRNKKKARLYMNKEIVLMTPGIKTTARLTSIGIKISL